MKLTLLPLSHPELTPIVVTGSVFAIGRNEPPFDGYDRNLVSRLSKRHARLFVEGGRAYIADLHSTNGTRHNGEPLAAAPARLTDGDELGFGELRFRVVLEPAAEEDAKSVAPPRVRLVLVPAPGKRDLAPVVITELPYLVRRHGEMFARVADGARSQLEFVSKRHAHFFQRGVQVLLEDLGSTNGTYVNGEKLTEQARPVRDADTVAFGGDDLVYRVSLAVEGHEDDTARTRLMAEVSRDAATVFVSSPTSFAEIFGHDDDEADGEAAAPPPPPLDRRPLARRRPPLYAPWRWRATLGAAAVVGAVSGVWWMGDPYSAEELYALLDAGAYREVALTANELLETRGSDADLARIATTATLRHVLPTWSDALRQGDRAAAAAALHEAAVLGTGNGADDGYLELLEWAGDVHFLLRELEQGEISSAAYLADAEGLLDWWQADEAARRAALDTLTGFAPGFDASRRRILAQIRALTLRKQQLEAEPPGG